MAQEALLFIIVYLSVHTVQSQWMCSTDEQCASVTGSVCLEGSCTCPVGQQVVLGGTACHDLAPYHASPCVEDHQCSRLFSSFECYRANETEIEGTCFCQRGYHYLYGRCWNSVDLGEECTYDEECLSIIRDPYSMKCNGTCQCAEGYYLRQRGECRKIGYAVGDGCVLDEDCQFSGGVCDHSSFTCVNANAYGNAASRSPIKSNSTTKIVPKTTGTRAHFSSCSIISPCPEPFICSLHGVCICPIGYYNSEDGERCLAELGSPSTEEQCAGVLAEVLNGICTCPPNFFFEEDMRNCVKVARSRTDSCMSDQNCFTFGSAVRCGEAQEELWNIRTCECIPELSVWDESRQMCRLFATIGETCQVDSDCLAGELEIQCVVGSDGVGYCACPEGLAEYEGLCITTGLELGDPCQATVECTETPNTVCADGRCSCGEGYQEEDGYCAPIIGGTCSEDINCVIENTICDIKNMTCQCAESFVAFDEECWPISSGFEAHCNVTAQCISSLGDASSCVNNQCVCYTGYHYRDGLCWPMTGLFETCSRISECYLGEISDRVHCRNSLCQCSFDYYFSEELQTCLSRSSAASIAGGVTSIAISLIYLLIR